MRFMLECAVFLWPKFALSQTEDVVLLFFNILHRVSEEFTVESGGWCVESLSGRRANDIHSRLNQGLVT